MRNALANLIYLRSLLRRPRTPNEIGHALDRLFLAARISDRRGLQRKAETKAHTISRAFNADGFDWQSFFPLSEPRQIEKSMILKLPRANGERGVLFISFEENWIRLFRHGDVAALARDYDLVLSPTWSPPQDLAMQVASSLWPRPLYSILSNMDDGEIFRRLYPNVVPVPLLASHWVNPEFFAPRHVAKEFDIAVLANFAAYKRHIALFRALKDARELSVVLLGRPWEGRTAAVLMEEAAAFGVVDQITIREGLDDEAMLRSLQSARVSLILSMNEGSCVAVAESLIADVPVGLIRDARVGSRCFINDQTGRFLNAGDLGSDLKAFVTASRTFSPRKWMLEHGHSYRESSARLNAALRAGAITQSLPWTTDIVPMQWRPNPEYLSLGEAALLGGDYPRFEEKYGIALKPPRSVVALAHRAE